MINYPKLDFCNGCILGIVMYDLTKNNLELKSTFQLCSDIIEIKKYIKEKLLVIMVLIKFKEMS